VWCGCARAARAVYLTCHRRQINEFCQTLLQRANVLVKASGGLDVGDARDDDGDDSDDDGVEGEARASAPASLSVVSSDERAASSAAAATTATTATTTTTTASASAVASVKQETPRTAPTAVPGVRVAVQSVWATNRVVAQRITIKLSSAIAAQARASAALASTSAATAEVSDGSSKVRSVSVCCVCSLLTRVRATGTGVLVVQSGARASSAASRAAARRRARGGARRRAGRQDRAHCARRKHAGLVAARGARRCVGHGTCGVCVRVSVIDRVCAQTTAAHGMSRRAWVAQLDNYSSPFYTVDAPGSVKCDRCCGCDCVA
jgi:hypothetical protein